MHSHEDSEVKHSHFNNETCSEKYTHEINYLYNKTNREKARERERDSVKPQNMCKSYRIT